MSKTINSYYFTSSGGGGVSEQDAILMVTVPSGSSLTATKGGVTLTPSMWVSNSDSSLEKAMFVFSPAQFDSVTSWRITATDTGKVATVDILIDDNKEYEIEINYSLMIVEDGVYILQLTPNGYGTVTQNTGNVGLSTTGNNITIAYINVDVTYYNYITLEALSGSQSWYSNQVPAIGISATTPSINQSSGAVTPVSKFTSLNRAQGPIQSGTYSCDISRYSGEMYVWVSTSGWGGALGRVYMYNFGLTV